MSESKDPLHHCGTMALQGISITATRFLLLTRWTRFTYAHGTLSAASSDRALSFPRKSTAETE